MGRGGGGGGVLQDDPHYEKAFYSENGYILIESYQWWFNIGYSSGLVA